MLSNIFFWVVLPTTVSVWAAATPAAAPAPFFSLANESDNSKNCEDDNDEDNQNVLHFRVTPYEV